MSRIDTIDSLQGLLVLSLTDTLRNFFFSLADGFTSYTTTTKTINRQAKSLDGEIILASGAVERVSKNRERKNKLVAAEATILLAKDSADIFLAPGGNLIQKLLVEESALAASARFKDSVRATLVDGPQRFRDALPFGVGSVLPPLAFEDQVAPFLIKTEKEIKAQRLAEKILAFVPRNEKRTQVDVSPQDSAAVVQSLRYLEPEQAALVLKELRENLPKYGPLVAALGGKFVSTLLHTASKNIDTTLTELELAGEPPDAGFREAVKGLSTAAQRGAAALTPNTRVEESSRR